MASEREFRLPTTLLAVLAVNAGLAVAAYGSCGGAAPTSAAALPPAPIVAAAVVVEAPVAVEPPKGPVHAVRDPFASPAGIDGRDGGTRDPCDACGRG